MLFCNVILTKAEIYNINFTVPLLKIPLPRVYGRIMTLSRGKNNKTIYAANPTLQILSFDEEAVSVPVAALSSQARQRRWTLQRLSIVLLAQFPAIQQPKF